MTDALILSGILLAIVLFTHVGRHKVRIVLLVLPFLTCGTIGYLVLADMNVTTPNLMAAVVGTAAGVAVGLGLVALTRVEGPYSRAGRGYLALWLAVLVGRLIFIYAIEHSRSFAVSVGRFLVDTGIDEDGVAAFFVAMALVMVLVRTVGVWVKWSGQKRAGSGATDPTRPGEARNGVATYPATVPAPSAPDGTAPRRDGV